MFKLIVEEGEPQGRVFDLHPGENTIGRSRTATCRIGAADVSGTHAMISLVDHNAVLENISQFGTLLDDVPVTSKVPLSAGQVIQIGNSTRLRVAAADELPTGELPTGSGATTAGPAVVPAPPSPPPAPPSPPAPVFQPSFAAAEEPAAATSALDMEFSELTRALPDMTMADDADATRAMQTRAVTPEELEHLRIAEQKRGQRKLAFIAAIIIALIAATLIFWPRQLPPELEIAWSSDAEGNYTYAFTPAPGNHAPEEGYEICYPDNGTFEKKTAVGKVVLEGYMGRKLTMPMRIVIQADLDRNFVTRSRLDAVQEWMETTASSGGRWNFDRPSPTPGFYGRRNGIPYTRVTYLRDGEGSWFGIASILLHGEQRIVASIEVPAIERVRAEKMMGVRLITPSPYFESTHWEGVESATRLDEAQTLRQVRAELDRTAPATWVALQKLLQNLLTQAVLAGHAETTSTAITLLARLREKQALYFNSQKLAFEAALMQNNYLLAGKIAEFSKAVFSDESDNRFFEVRKWRAEP